MGMPIVVYFESISFSSGRSVLATHIDSQVEQIERARVGLIIVGFDFDSQLSGRQHRHQQIQYV